MLRYGIQVTQEWTSHENIIFMQRVLSLKSEECVSIFLSISVTSRLQQNTNLQLNIGTFYAQRAGTKSGVISRRTLPSFLRRASKDFYSGENRLYVIRRCAYIHLAQRLYITNVSNLCGGERQGIIQH